MPSSSLTPETTPALTRVTGPSPELSAWLRNQTPARVGLRRAGLSLATSEVLDFQFAHARARDAVYAPLQPSSLLQTLRSLPYLADSGPPVLLHSQAINRQNYLQRPDLGRKLDETSRNRLTSLTASSGTFPNSQIPAGEIPAAEIPSAEIFDLALIVADGLSALAVDRHAAPLISALLPALAAADLNPHLAPICVVEQGRVAIGDEIAHTLRARLAIVLIGERPGLSSPDSLGAYITWQPQPGRTTDADRNCISNIRTEGLGYHAAAARLIHYIREAHAQQRTGVSLKDPVLKDPDLSSSPQLQAGQTP
jgi:ethanolamine ammonia-lyase small subunit